MRRRPASTGESAQRLALRVLRRASIAGAGRCEVSEAMMGAVNHITQIGSVRVQEENPIGFAAG